MTCWIRQRSTRQVACLLQLGAIRFSGPLTHAAVPSIGRRLDWERLRWFATEQTDVLGTVDGQDGGAVEKQHAAAVSSCNSRSSAREAARRALLDYLHLRKQIPLKEALQITANAPMFVSQLVLAANNYRASVLGRVSAEGVDVSQRAVMDEYLKKFEVSELEPFLESIGMKPDEFDGSSLGFCLHGDHGLLLSTNFLESIGIHRGKLWKLLERDKQLLTCSASQLSICVRSLLELGVENKNLPGLVEVYPPLLRINVQERLQEMLKYFEEVGLERSLIAALLKSNAERVVQVGNANFMENIAHLSSMGVSDKQLLTILRRNPQVLVMDLETDILPKIAVLEDLGLGLVSINNLFASFPAVLSYSMDQNLLPKINFLLEVGVERKVICDMLERCPAILGKNITKAFAQKIKFLEAAGVKKENMGLVIQRSPTLLCMSIKNNMSPKIQFLESIGLEKESVGIAITRHPALFECSMEDNLKPTVAFLQKMGFTGGKLAKLITWKPSVLSRAIDGSLQNIMNFLLRMGLKPGSIAMARGLITCVSFSISTMERRVNHLVSLGFSHDVAYEMIRKQPSLLALSETKIRDKYLFISQALNLEKLEVGLIALLLTFSLEKRLKPRVRVLSSLRSNGLLTKEYAISTTMNMSNQQFCDTFVKGFPVVNTIFEKVAASL